MTRQDMREKLLRVGWIIREEIRIAEQVDQLRTRQTAASKLINGMPGGGQIYTLEDYAADLDKLERKFLDKLHEERETYVEILGILDQLKGTKREIMIEHYLMLRSWERIAVDRDVSYRYIMKLNRQALDELVEKYGSGSL